MTPFGGRSLWTLVVAVGGVLAPGAQAGECKAIHADLFEAPATQGCLAPLASCFLGEVSGNHGLRGTTHFAADSARAGPSTSPAFISYSGLFHYFLDGGTLVTRETGVTSAGRVTAYQEILEGTGAFAGATGYFFVSGNKTASPVTITTRVTGEVCLP